MQCPYCKAVESRVVDSRVASAATVTWRRRECEGCHRRFTTYERVEHSLPTVIKSDGRREAFNREKLERGMRIACNKRPIADEEIDAQVESLEQDLAQEGSREISSRVLGERVMDSLKNLDEVAYVRFASVYRSFRDIDEFIDEMSKLVRSRTTE